MPYFETNSIRNPFLMMEVFVSSFINKCMLITQSLMLWNSNYKKFLLCLQSCFTTKTKKTYDEKLFLSG